MQGDELGRELPVVGVHTRFRLRAGDADEDWVVSRERGKEHYSSSSRPIVSEVLVGGEDVVGRGFLGLEASIRKEGREVRELLIFAPEFRVWPELVERSAGS